MAYPSFDNLGLKIPFDIDGSAALITNGNDGTISFLSKSQREDLTDIDYLTDSFTATSIPWGTYTFVFPQPYHVHAFNAVIINTNANTAPFSYTYNSALSAANQYRVEVSYNTTNGVDGSWEEPLFPDGQPPASVQTVDGWRIIANRMTFTTGPMTGFRIISTAPSNQFGVCRVHNVHIYGDKADGFNVDDIQFLNDDLSVMHSVIDFGDVANPTLYDTQFHIKNKSPSKTAFTVALLGETDRDASDSQVKLSHTSDFTGATSSLSVGDLASGATYAVHLRLAPAAGTAPQSLRVKYTVASWA